MAPQHTQGHTRQQLLQLQQDVGEWQDEVDELLTLAQYGGDVAVEQDRALQIDPVVQACSSIYTELNSIRASVAAEKDAALFNELLSRYIRVWTALQSAEIHLVDVAHLQLSDADKVAPREEEPAADLQDSGPVCVPPKSVRFKDNIVEASPPARFKPYRDSINELVQDDSEIDNPTLDMSNTQIFIHNQNQFEYQDNQLDQLHGSVKQQRQISNTINTELSEQFLLMDDLEAGVDASNARLIRSNNRLTQYRDALKKRGDWMCILILIFVLLFLLIVIN